MYQNINKYLYYQFLSDKSAIFVIMSIQVVTNEKGKKTAVLVPIADWEEIQKRLNTEQFFDEFASSVKAIKEDIAGNGQLKNAIDLIHANRG